ncbi:phenylalanine--tRNA ligase subunit alpha [Amnibacterium sp. CER49]|uniref:phenylalanine--tRNA ligase subunit alpha n=1 Tax=Amnibacterium sp. CER49 TaxID=3039161 RepID=UPI00244B1690|nr:phenylalanine--tRNA ligase subunit alpha [Amnibacterium sp. CER49]MDH2444964.1 phenylalanine--tRNA ligase subunit alpha [Amnibacterium sp. CER49]
MSGAPSIDQAEVDAAVDAALQAVAAAATSADLKAARIAHTGEASPLARLNARLRDLPGPEKPAAGKLVGGARGRVNGAVAAREAQLLEVERAARLEAERVDVTAAPVRHRPGARHPLTLVRERVEDVFVAMGWEIAEGPELEHEWFNFDALNIDPDHPARSPQDTLFVEPEGAHLVMRTQTSPVQVRSLLDRGAPLYVLGPGRVYRTDEIDATHLPVFNQFEGIAIDRGLTMAHLRGTLEHLARLLFGEAARIRLRPNFFPFTEPSAEMDVWHPTIKGGARWIEWGGCGMVHPNVLRAAGLDPEEFQGFAFGLGIERTLQFAEGLTDMRDMIEGDVRFSRQWGLTVK